MLDKVTINLVTEDPSTDEFVLYVVEDGPWPNSDDGWKACLNRIQNHVLDVFDAVVDGGLAKEYPDSVGSKVRIQIDSPSGLPDQLSALVSKIDDFVHQSDNVYGKGISKSTFVTSLRIVTGHASGRFENHG